MRRVRSFLAPAVLTATSTLAQGQPIRAGALEGYFQVADPTRSAAYAERFLRAFDVLAFSFLAFTLICALYVAGQLILCYAKAYAAAKSEEDDDDVLDLEQMPKHHQHRLGVPKGG